MSMLFNVLASTKYSAMAVFTKVSDILKGTITDGGKTISGGDMVFFSSEVFQQNIVDGGVYGFDFIMDLSGFTNNSTAYIGFGDADSIGAGLSEVVSLALSKDAGGNLEIQLGDPVAADFSSPPVAFVDDGSVITLSTETTGGVTNCKVYKGVSATPLIDYNLAGTYTSVDRILAFLPTSASVFAATLQDGALPIPGITQVTVAP